MSQLVDPREHLFDQATSSFRVIQSDVIRDGLKIGQGGIGPNYLSHRAMRFLAAS